MNSGANSNLEWNKYDADQKNEELMSKLESYYRSLLNNKGIDCEDADTVSNFIKTTFNNKSKESIEYLYKTIGVEIFKPEEFKDCEKYDNSLNKLSMFFGEKKFDWKRGSESVKKKINENFKSAGKPNLKGAHESVRLDNLILIDEIKVAIEIETSNNIDNGYYTLRLAVKEKLADFGVMIVPWTNTKGRADQDLALGRLDREFNESNKRSDGPIYRMGIIRIIDLFRIFEPKAFKPRRMNNVRHSK